MSTNWTSSSNLSFSTTGRASAVYTGDVISKSAKHCEHVNSRFHSYQLIVVSMHYVTHGNQKQLKLSAAPIIISKWHICCDLADKVIESLWRIALIQKKTMKVEKTRWNECKCCAIAFVCELLNWIVSIRCHHSCNQPTHYNCTFLVVAVSFFFLADPKWIGVNFIDLFGQTCSATTWNLTITEMETGMGLDIPTQNHTVCV